MAVPGTLDHLADLDADRRLSPRNVAAGSAGAAQAAGVHEGAAALHIPALPAVTLSDMEGQGERAHCRRSARQLGAGSLPLWRA